MAQESMRVAGESGTMDFTLSKEQKDIVKAARGFLWMNSPTGCNDLPVYKNHSDL
jgi:hypothetical protein